MKTPLQALTLAVAAALASAESMAGSGAPAAPPQPSALPVFQTRNLGAPKIRIGGGSRGPEQTGAALYVLAPEQVGLTTREQPVLYWFIAKPVAKPIEIAVTDKKSVLLKTTLDGVSQAGIQRLDLAGQGVRLSASTQYQWSVALVNDPKQRPGDTFTSGGIALVPETEALKAKLAAAATDKGRAFVYAEEGIWYDALEAAQRWVEQAPGDTVAAKMRANLFEQVALPPVGMDGE